MSDITFTGGSLLVSGLGKNFHGCIEHLEQVELPDGHDIKVAVCCYKCKKCGKLLFTCMFTGSRMNYGNKYGEEVDVSIKEYKPE